MRLDRFLFFIRIFKSRSLANKSVISGKVRINGSLIYKGHKKVVIGEKISIDKYNHIRIIKILDFPKRRGSFDESKLFYKDLTPKENLISKTKEKLSPFVYRKTGRPTKMDRRKIDKLMGRN